MFEGPEPLHRYNLHFTEGFLSSSRYKAVTRPLQGVTKGNGITTDGHGCTPMGDTNHTKAQIFLPLSSRSGGILNHAWQVFSRVGSECWFESL